MKVMKPRTKKGPSWANEEAQISKKAKETKEATPMEDTAQEGVSDMDWLKKHMSKNVDNVEKAYEQSDDELDENVGAEVCCHLISLVLYTLHFRRGFPIPNNPKTPRKKLFYKRPACFYGT